MKQVICTILFFVLFVAMHTLVSLVFPYLYYLWFVIWVIIGLISLVVCKLIYDWLEQQERGYLPPKRRAIVFFSLVFVAISVFGFRYWNEHQEKPLEDVLDSYSYPKEISVNPNTINWIIKDSQSIRKLVDFLSQYDVQKTGKVSGYHMSDSYDIWWENKKGFRGPATIMLRIEKNDIWINMEHYKVLNGPVDMEWMKNHLKD